MPTSIKIVIGVLLLGIVGFSVLYFVKSPGDSSKPLAGVIESINPQDGDKTLQNGQITVDLLTGWTGRFTIDQKEIPDNQVVKVPEQGLLTFQPGKGKALEYFPAGQNCVIFTYWQVATGPDSSFTKNWCFTAF